MSYQYLTDPGDGCNSEKGNRIINLGFRGWWYSAEATGATGVCLQKQTDRSEWYVVPQNNGNGNGCEKHLDPCHKNANSLPAIGKG